MVKLVTKRHNLVKKDYTFKIQIFGTTILCQLVLTAQNLKIWENRRNKTTKAVKKRPKSGWDDSKIRYITYLYTY